MTYDFNPLMCEDACVKYSQKYLATRIPPLPRNRIGTIIVFWPKHSNQIEM